MMMIFVFSIVFSSKMIRARVHSSTTAAQLICRKFHASACLNFPIPEPLATTDLGKLRSYVGNSNATHIVTQRIDAATMTRFAHLVNRSPMQLSQFTGSASPAQAGLSIAGQWPYFQPFDGGDFDVSHASPDGLLPVLDGRRRWAGGTFLYSPSSALPGASSSLLNRIQLGDVVERVTRVASVQEKRGRSGRFAVVALEDRFRITHRPQHSEDHLRSCRRASASASSPSASAFDARSFVDEYTAPLTTYQPHQPPALIEIRDCVYPLQPFAPSPPAPAPPITLPSSTKIDIASDTLFASCDAVTELTPSSDLLFRFSALTYNCHRIHYDAPYAALSEGLPGCIVHGPLAVTLAGDALQSYLFQRFGSSSPAVNPVLQLQKITYRNISPLMSGQPLYIGIQINNSVTSSSSAKLQQVSSISSQSGYQRAEWIRGQLSMSPVSSSELKTAQVSIWSNLRQLAVTLTAEF